MVKYSLSFFILLFTFNSLISQANFNVRLESVEIAELGGLQSYTYGVHENYWLIFGGRLDGLHMKQPFASFDASGNNNHIILVDIEEQRVWKTPLESLSVNLKEQLSSTNMQFHQQGNQLVITGGYGYSPTSQDHISYPYLTVVDIPGLIEAIKSEKEISPFFIYQEDQYFAVTGGQLRSINDTLYLVGGHKFTGRYNPHGPDHGPGFEQQYTSEIRPFTLKIKDQQIDISKLSTIHDERHLRRRDYNLVSQINNNKQELMMFSGVFQPSVDLPWLYPVSITNNDYNPIENFTQYFNHYHCAVAPIYDSLNNSMHNIFFGGIAQFYMDGDVMVQDDDVPFVKTIAEVIRHADGSLTENRMESEMPSLLGAGSEFILNPELDIYSNGVIKSDQFSSNDILIGHIYGGIESTQKNIFWINDGSQSKASGTIYKVFIQNTNTVSNSDIDISDEPLILIYPNPNNGDLRIKMELKSIEKINIQIFDISGQSIFSSKIPDSKTVLGKNLFEFNLENKIQAGTYLVRFQVGNQNYTRKLVLSE